MVQNIFYQPPKSDSSDHTSDNENSPPPKIFLKKEYQKQEGKQQPTKEHMKKRLKKVQEQVTTEPVMQAEQQLLLHVERLQEITERHLSTLPLSVCRSLVQVRRLRWSSG